MASEGIIQRGPNRSSTLPKNTPSAAAMNVPIVTAHVISARDQPNSSDIGFKKMPKKDPFSPTRGIPPESTTPTMNQP